MWFIMTEIYVMCKKHMKKVHIKEMVENRMYANCGCEFAIKELEFNIVNLTLEREREVFVINETKCQNNKYEK